MKEITLTEIDYPINFEQITVYSPISFKYGDRIVTIKKGDKFWFHNLTRETNTQQTLTVHGIIRGTVNNKVIYYRVEFIEQVSFDFFDKNHIDIHKLLYWIDKGVVAIL